MKEKIIFYTNILIISIIFIFLCFSLRYEINNAHDFWYPYSTNTAGRIPSYFLFCLTNNWLPKILSINPNDLRIYLTNTIISLTIIFCSLIWTKAFFLTDKKNINILKKKESILTIITCSLFFIIQPKAPNFLLTDLFIFNAREAVVFFEYHFLYIFIFSFFICLYKLIYKKENINKSTFTLCIINAFLCGFWNEQFSVFILFSLLSFTLYLFCFERTVLKNNKLKYFILSFFIGFIFFIIFSDYSNFTDNKIADHTYTIQEGLSNFKQNYKSFFEYFYKDIFTKNIFTYILLLILLIKTFLKKAEKKKPIIALTLSIFIGFLLLNLSYAFVIKVSCNAYMFQRDTNFFFNTLTPIFCSFLLLGYNYINSDKILTKVFTLIILICSTIIYGYFLINNYSSIISNKKIKREALYNLDKTVILCSKYSKDIKVPVSIFSNENIGTTRIFTFQDDHLNKNKEEIDRELVGKTIYSNETEYGTYIQNQYNISFDKLTIVDNESLPISLEKETNNSIDNKTNFKQLLKI